MLKRIIVNRRSVPVPVPLRTLDEACAWAAQALARPGWEITRVFLDGRDVEEQRVARDAALGPMSQLEILMDSPRELAAQSADTVQNLCSLVINGLEHLAVAAWQTTPGQAFPRADALLEDLRLARELADHLLGLVPGTAPEAIAIAQTLQRIDRDSARLGFPRPFPRDPRAFARDIANDSLVPAFRALGGACMALKAALESGSLDAFDDLAPGVARA